jgi:hypothetical protein
MAPNNTSARKGIWRRRSASTALLGVAFIQGLVCALYYWLQSFTFGFLDWVFTFSFSIFLVLAITAIWAPILSSSIALALYAAFLAQQALLTPELLFEGVIVKAPIVGLLLCAVISAIWNARPAKP